MDREKRRAGDTGGAAGDIADRQELRTGEVPRAAAGRADESKLDGARATDSAGGGEAAERAGADRRVQATPGGRADGMGHTPGDVDGCGRAGAVGSDAGPEPGDPLDERTGGGAGAARDDGDGHDANPDWPDAEPAQELGVAADRSDRAAAPGAGGQTLEECRSAGPGVPAGSSARSTGECADGGSRAAAGSAPDPAGTTAAASSPDPAGSGAANPADAAAESCGGRPAAPGSRPGIDEVVALPSGGGAWFRKTTRKLKGQKRADRDEKILSLLAQGYRNKAIARELGIDVKTVRRVRKGAKKRKPRASKLDAFKPVIQELVVKKDLTAIRVLREIRALGYKGGYSVLKEYARSIRRRSRRRPHLRFETEKGKQGQVDLSDYTVDLGGQATDVVCFSMVFGYSRWQNIRFTETANAHSVCHSHVLSFEKAGGAPHEMLYDRMKQVVLESYANRVVLHPLFAALVNHYGFKAIPLAPGYKEGKGKVENPFKFVYSDLLKGSTFHDLEDLNRKAEAWLRDIAWVRKHGTTQERPLDRMDEERPYLIPLPPRPFVAARVEDRFVGFDFCIAWDTNRYSVSPSFVGRSVKAMALDGILDIYVEGEIITRHQLRKTRHKRYILPEHESEFRQHSTSRHLLQEQFSRLGEIAQAFTDGLVKAHGGSAGYHISEILKLADQVGMPRVLEALRHAARYGAFSHTSVARIVRGKQPPRQRAASFPCEPPPKHVAEYLKASGHSQRPLEHYERLLKEKTRKPQAWLPRNEINSWPTCVAFNSVMPPTASTICCVRPRN